MPRDKIIVSLIMVAVALPTRLIIGRLFEVSNEPAGTSAHPSRTRLGTSSAAGTSTPPPSHPPRRLKRRRHLHQKTGVQAWQPLILRQLR